jgi:hypothetical protein
VTHDDDALALALHLADDRLQPRNHVQVRLATGVPAAARTQAFSVSRRSTVAPIAGLWLVPDRLKPRNHVQVRLATRVPAAATATVHQG